MKVATRLIGGESGGVSLVLDTSWVSPGSVLSPSWIGWPTLFMFIIYTVKRTFLIKGNLV